MFSITHMACRILCLFVWFLLRDEIIATGCLTKIDRTHNFPFNIGLLQHLHTYVPSDYKSIFVFLSTYTWFLNKALFWQAVSKGRACFALGILSVCCQKFVQSTPARIHSISGLKSQVLKLTFLAYNNGEKWSRFFYFEIQRAPSEIPANLPGQFSLTRQNFFALGSSNSEGANKRLDHFLPLFLGKKNVNFKTRDFSPLIKWDLAGVVR